VITAKQIERSIERSIGRVAKEFRQGTVNFRCERNYQCLLFKYLREMPGSRIPSEEYKAGIELVHAEFPASNRAKEHYDLVILTHSSAKKFERGYGDKVGDWAKKMRLMSVFEAKHRLTLTYDKEIEKDIRRLKWIQRKKITKHAYLLIFIDNEVDWNNYNYRSVLRRFERNSKKCPGLEIYCIPGQSGDMLRIKRSRAIVIF